MSVEIYKILRKRYPESEYSLLTEVSDQAGASRGRSIDFIVMSLWPSRGLNLMGVELKSFRGDWLREMKNPKKQESIYKYCDQFWLLTKDDSIARLEEIPETWGWMCVKGGKIHVLKDAPKLSPENLSRSFLAALLKRSSSKDGFVLRDSIKDEIEAAKQSQRKDFENTQFALNRKIEKLEKCIEQYAESTGVNIEGDRWRSNTNQIGKAVKLLQNGGAEKLKKDLVFLKGQAQSVLNSISPILDELAEIDLINLDSRSIFNSPGAAL